MLGFLMMVLTRIYPLVSPLESGIFNKIDAIKAVVISGFIMLGMYYMIRIYTSMVDQSHIFELDAKTDTMTGALRRKETFDRLEQEISRSFRNHQPLALVMIKLVNDRYGHLVGDVVLKNLVAFYQERLRDIDILGRVGGEEFLVILPATNESDALEITERLRKALQDHVVARVNHDPIKITTSGGISIFNPEQELDLIHKDLANKYFQQADLAMYQAKQLGRNQSYVWKDT
jgi:diguanylate cyclase (GGDEF)-like protein